MPGLGVSLDDEEAGDFSSDDRHIGVGPLLPILPDLIRAAGHAPLRARVLLALVRLLLPRRSGKNEPATLCVGQSCFETFGHVTQPSLLSCARKLRFRSFARSGRLAVLPRTARA